MIRRILLLLTITFPLATTGCLLGPDYETPDVPIPDGYLNPGLEGDSIANTAWWDLFQDETLRRLIDIALEENKDLAEAVARIDEARATLGFTRADQYPSFRYGGSAVRADPSNDVTPAPNGPRNDFSAGLDAFFEVDLWGKLRRATEAARAELLATEAAYRTVTITLIAEVASTYLLLRDQDEQLNIAIRTHQARKDSLKIIRDRFDGGYTDRLDVHQAEIEEATADAEVAGIERVTLQTEHALAILLGRNPGRVERGRDLTDQDLPLEVPAGLPSELLQRRPDIRTSEARLAAQTARIGIAEALRFPSLTLTGAYGSESQDLEDLFSAGTGFWSLGGGLTGPLFEFGKNKRRVEAEEARTRALLADYERTVLNAFREVEDALVAIRTFAQEHEARGRQVEAARGAATLARALYDEDFTSYLEVLDAERSLFRAEIEQSAALRQRLLAVISLYKALGGGWVPPTTEAARPATTTDTEDDEDTP